MNSGKVAANTAIVKLDKMSSSHSLKIRKLSTNRLAIIVKAGFKKLKHCVPYMVELRERFRNAPRGKANIDGCQSWTEFIEKNFDGTTLRHIDRLLFHYNEGPTFDVQGSEQKTPSRKPATIEVTGHVIDITPKPATFPVTGKAQEIVRQVKSREISPQEGHNRLQAGIDEIKSRYDAMVMAEKTAERSGDDGEQAKQARQNRVSRYWLETSLQSYDRTTVALGEPEEMRLTPANREILRDVIDWLQRVCEVGKR